VWSAGQLLGGQRFSFTVSYSFLFLAAEHTAEYQTVLLRVKTRTPTVSQPIPCVTRCDACRTACRELPVDVALMQFCWLGIWSRPYTGSRFVPRWDGQSCNRMSDEVRGELSPRRAPWRMSVMYFVTTGLTQSI